MSDINLTFLDDNYSKNQITYVDMLEKYGRVIAEYSKGYFDSVVTMTDVDGDVKDITLYILVPELPYEFPILHIEILNIANVKLTLNSLVSSTQHTNINVVEGIGPVEIRIKQFLGTKAANESLRLLISKINLKRKTNYKEGN